VYNQLKHDWHNMKSIK